MAFVLAIILFVGGMYLFGLAITLTSLQGLVFFAGIVAVSLAIAIPVHFLNSRSAR